MTTPHPSDASYRDFREASDLDARAAFWARFLDVMHGCAAVHANHRRSAELLGLRPGYALLDVGCGTGLYACDAAPLTAPGGRVSGIDASDALVALARRRAAERGLAVDFRVADALALPYPDASFDGARTERVLQYVGDPARAAREMARVTRPGGVVVATEVDWDGSACDAPGLDRAAWRRGNAAVSDASANGWMGREVRRVLLDAGLADVGCEGGIAVITDAATVLDDMAGRQTFERARDAGAVTAEETARLVESMERAGRSGRSLWGIPLYTAWGRVPEPARR